MIRLLCQKNGFSRATINFIIKDGVEQIPDEIKNDLIQVDEQTFKDLQAHKLMWQNGTLVSNPNYQEYVTSEEQRKHNVLIRKRIKELKQSLAETDYRALKYFEGYYTDEEYAPYKAQRQAYRDEINALEKELEALEKGE